MTAIRPLFVALVLGFVASTALAQSQRPPVEKRERMTVGLINLLDQDAIHAHVAGGFFGSFAVPKPGTDWDMDKVFEEAVLKRIGSKPGVTVRTIEPPHWLMAERLKLYGSGWTDSPLNKGLVPLFDEFSTQQSVDVFVVLAPFMGKVDRFKSIEFAGHGLLTQCSGKKCSAEPLLNFVVVVIETDPTPRVVTQPFTMMKITKADGVDIAIRDVPFGGDLKQLAAEEVDKARPAVVLGLEITVLQMLRQAGMEPAEVD